MGLSRGLWDHWEYLHLPRKARRGLGDEEAGQVRCRLAWHRVRGEQNGCPPAEATFQLSPRPPAGSPASRSLRPALDFGYFSGPGRTDAAFVLPQHVTDRDDLKPPLRHLLSHFHIPGDVRELSDSAKEMELFSSVHNALLL